MLLCISSWHCTKGTNPSDLGPVLPRDIFLGRVAHTKDCDEKVYRGDCLVIFYFLLSSGKATLLLTIVSGILMKTRVWCVRVPCSVLPERNIVNRCDQNGGGCERCVYVVATVVTTFETHSRILKQLHSFGLLIFSHHPKELTHGTRLPG